MSLEETRTVMLSTGHGAEPEPVVVPLRVGNVKLGNLLGEGAGGAVFTGFDEILNRQVAVKLLHRRRGAAISDSAMVELDRGLRAAAGVRHPGLLTIHAVDHAAGMPVIVMEFIDGASLRDLLAHGGKFEPALALHVLRVATDAVAALHEAGVVHRDLKPANVMFDRAGNVRVCDFGLACEIDPGTFRGRAAEVGGSPLYMAPEMFDGNTSPQSDVYALGIILFEMLIGAPPFAATSISDLKICHRENEPPIWRMEREDIPEAAKEIVRRALHKRSYLRYKTAGHLVRALDEISEPRYQAEAQRARLAELIAIRTAGPESDAPSSPDATPAMTTFDLLSQRAKEKRAGRSKH